MVLKIGFDHLLSHLAGRGAKVASGPKMPAPVVRINKEPGSIYLKPCSIKL